MTKTKQNEEIRHVAPNVITVTFRYGQLVPVKVIKGNQDVPTQVCTRSGVIYELSSGDLFEPITEEVLAVHDHAVIEELVSAPWIFPIEQYILIEKSTSSRVEDFENLFIRYRNR